MTALPGSLAALSADVASLAAAAETAVVAIEHKRQAISGFYWQPDIIATVSERLEAPTGGSVQVYDATGHTHPGTVIGHDPGTDLALIRVAPSGTRSGPPLPSAGTPLGLGQAVVALGRVAHGATAALGFVALAGPAWRSMRGGEITQRVWIDARLMRSTEGGAVINTAGALVGMAVFGPRRRVVLIPTATLERAGSELLAHGRIRQGYLGLSVQAVKLPGGPGVGPGVEPATGLMVLGRDEGGPAAHGGILPGDIITAIDGTAPHSPRDLMRLLPGSAIGRHARVDLVRAGQATHLVVTIGERPVQ